MLPDSDRRLHAVGVLVQTNYGGNLQILGVPIPGPEFFVLGPGNS